VKRALLLVAIGLGCVKSEVELLDDLPADVTRVAVVLLDDQGRLRDATGLVPRRAAVVVSRPVDEASALWVLGFSDADLARAELPSAAALEEQVLRIAGECEPALPSPSWARGPSDVVMPRLTATWVADSCGETPKLYPAHDCDAKVSSWTSDRRGCFHRVDLWQHGLGNYEGWRDPFSGEYCMVLTDERRAECRPDPAEGDRRWLCSVGNVQECQLSFEESGPPLDVALDRVRVYSATVAPAMAITTHGELAIEVRRGFTGYLSDLVTLDDRVIVAGHQGRVEQFECWQLSGDSDLIVVSQDDLQVVRRTGAYRCLMRMVRDPSGPGFLAAFVEADTWYLGRFDESAELVTSSSIAPIMDFDVGGWRSAEVVTMRSGEIAVVLSTKTAVASGSGAYVVITDADLEQKRSSDLLNLDVMMALDASTATHDPNTHIVLADREEEGVVWLEVERLEPSPGARRLVPFNDHVQSSPMAMWMHEGQLLAAVGGNAGIVAFGNGFDWGGFASALELPGYPTAMVDWSPDASLLAVLMARPIVAPDFEAHLMWLDPAEERFRSGAVEIGFGVASRAENDARGRIWAILPWAAELVRITPAP